jgi:hypothetical protein
MARVGCPDRRIDRHCITCCSLSQPSHHAGCPTRSRLYRKRDGFLVTLSSGHHRPDHPRILVGERDSSDLSRPPRQQCREPGPMLGAMDLGIADDGERTDHEQAAQIAVTCLLMLPSLSLPPLECCFGTSPIQAEKLRPDRKILGSTRSKNGTRQRRPDVRCWPGVAARVKFLALLFSCQISYKTADGDLARVRIFAPAHLA